MYMFGVKYQDSLYSKCSIFSILLSFILYPHILPSFSPPYPVDCFNFQQVSPLPVKFFSTNI